MLLWCLLLSIGMLQLLLWMYLQTSPFSVKFAVFISNMSFTYIVQIRRVFIYLGGVFSHGMEFKKQLDYYRHNAFCANSEIFGGYFATFDHPWLHLKAPRSPYNPFQPLWVCRYCTTSCHFEDSVTNWYIIVHCTFSGLITLFCSLQRKPGGIKRTHWPPGDR